MNMPWILFTLYLILILLVLKKWLFFQNTVKFSWLAIILILKIISGFIIADIYDGFYKGGDTYSIMADARIVYSSLFESPSLFFQFISGIEIDKPELQIFYRHFGTVDSASYNKLFNDPLIIIRINALLCIFSFGYYQVQLLLMCFLSLIGLTAIYKTVVSITKANEWMLSIACFGIPSVMAWGSVVLKEPMVLLFMGLMLYHFNHWLISNKFLSLLLFSIAAFFLLGLRPYILLVMLPGLIAWWFFQLKKKWLLKIYLVSYSIAYGAAVFLSKVSEQWNFFRMLSDQQIIFMKNAVYRPANSLIELIPFAPNPVSVIVRSPMAVWVALVRPYFTECKNILHYFAAIENWLILLFIIVLLINIDFKKVHSNPFAALCVFSGIIILIITAYTTPVLGTLVRLKMPGILLIIVGFASCTRNKIPIG